MISTVDKWWLTDPLKVEFEVKYLAMSSTFLKIDIIMFSEISGRKVDMSKFPKKGYNRAWNGSCVRKRSLTGSVTNGDY